MKATSLFSQKHRRRETRYIPRGNAQSFVQEQTVLNLSAFLPFKSIRK
jgi:hypothetical protein